MKKIQLISAMSLACLSLFATVKVEAANSDSSTDNQKQTTSVQSSSTSGLQSGVNDYIKNNNLQYSGIDNQEKSSTFTQGGNYRNGKPEGIVVHETAEPNVTAQQWTDIFNAQWQKRQTYVHAFVDHSKVIQIAPTNKTVWGAGYYANQRFIQVELCEENNLQDFAQSVNNDAIYIAGLLHQYNLTPSLADKSGSGTIWSHHDVSRYLGDTDHTDPDGYFEKYGYSMDQFFNLINKKYYEKNNEVPKNNVTDTSSVIKINYNGKGKVAIWDNYDNSKSITGKYLANNTRLSCLQIATDRIGKKWYAIGKNQWIDGQYIIADKLQYTFTNKIVTIKYNGPGKVALWGFFGNKKKLIGKYLANNSSWKTFKTIIDENGKIWYNLGGNQWLDGQYIR